MIRPESFLIYTLFHRPRGESVARIPAATFQTVESGAAVSRFIQREGGIPSSSTNVNTQQFQI
ncbi:MAG: hypothetical protein HY867_00020 [Chloroflexi bacterium]|nr:hypothetical protein [Chloroflexota bacterium]